MSCRSTRAGTASLRLVRRETGLSDKEATSLFHALKREGLNCAPPTLSHFKEWQQELTELLNQSDQTEAQKARTRSDLEIIESEDYDGRTFYALSMIVKRAKQEAALKVMRERSIEMDEPGSQSVFYDLDSNGIPKQVWYASYGSNINSERFHTYLTGDDYRGQLANSGGSRDKSLPEEEEGVLLPGRLMFASRGARWGGGGIAFLDVDDEYSFSAGKAYSVSWEQFEDVLAQESGGAAGSKKVDWNELKKLQDLDSGGLYGRIVHVGDYKGKPVLTFTGSYSAQELAADYRNDSAVSRYRTANRPHGNYLRTIGEGLSDSFWVDSSHQADYFAGSIGGHLLSSEEIKTVLETDYEVIKQTPKRPLTSNNYRRSALNERVRYEPSANSHKRDYVPWWEDPDDLINQKASGVVPTREDEIPDWWWDVDSNEDLYGDDTPNFDEPDDYQTPFARTRKRCVICNEANHDMHDCPWL